MISNCELTTPPLRTFQTNHKIFLVIAIIAFQIQTKNKRISLLLQVVHTNKYLRVTLTTTNLN